MRGKSCERWVRKASQLVKFIDAVKFSRFRLLTQLLRSAYPLACREDGRMPLRRAGQHTTIPTSTTHDWKTCCGWKVWVHSFTGILFNIPDVPSAPWSTSGRCLPLWSVCSPSNPFPLRAQTSRQEILWSATKISKHTVNIV